MARVKEKVSFTLIAPRKMPLLAPRLLGVLACLVNFGMLVFNVGFTRTEPIEVLNPQVFSVFGQVMILVWGVAFLLAGLGDDKPSYIWWAFTLEKAMYVGSWLSRLREIPSPTGLLDLAPVFHTIYGPVDAIFMLLFAQQGIAAMKKNRDDDAAGLKRA